jgi:2-oxoisovalerate dehydrogenase E2 component (dihydrolipoyl transacylase)
VQEGDAVALDQIIAEVETAKAMVELPSPHAGIVERLYVPPGTTVKVGDPLIAFRVDDREPVLTAAPDALPPNLVGYGAAAETAGRPARRPRSFAAAAVNGMSTAVAERPAPPVLPAPDRRPSTPPVRRLAERLGVRIDDIEGTGERGLVTREDVERAVGRRAPQSAIAVADPQEDVERIPIRGVRRRTADAMVASAFTAPHVTMFLTVDVTATVELLESLRTEDDFREVRLTFLAAVAKALCLAVHRHPEVNARWDGDAGEILRFRRVHLGIAVATPRGLLVPVLPDAGAAALPELAGRIAMLTAAARDGRTTPAELSGSTITITNVGVFGVDAGTPILNAGEAAILAVGAVVRRPWEWQGGIALRDLVTLSLSIDHRVLDGQQGAQLLAEVGRLLADPARAFAL